MVTRPRERVRIGWPVAAAAVATALAAVAVVGASSSDPAPAANGLLPTWLVVTTALAGVALAAGAWFTVAFRPRVPLGLAVVAVGLLLPTWATWTWLSPLARNVVLGVAPLAIAGVGQVGLAWQSDGYPHRIVRVGYLLAGSAAMVLVVSYDPFREPGCPFTCASGSLVEGWGRFTRQSVLLAGSLVLLAAVTMTPWLLRRLGRGRPRWVVFAALAAEGLLCAFWIARIVRWTDPLPPSTLLALPVAAAGVLGVTTFLAGLGLHRSRRAVARVVDRISASRVLAGPVRTDVVFAIPDEDRWVDRTGDPVAEHGAPGRHVVIADQSGPVARLRLSPGDDPHDVLAGLTPPTLLALRNEQLEAVTRARLTEVLASRRRVVAAADAERQRIERDLHDGAQQHLVSAAFHLSLARQGAQGLGVHDTASLMEVDQLVGETLASLRRIGHGIFPAVLTTEGLRAALEDLGSESPIPITVQVPDLALTSEAAMAAYVAVVAIVAQVRTDPSIGELRITAESDAGWATVTVITMGGSGLGADRLLDIEDRVAAAGGRVTQQPVAQGYRLVTVVPCVS